MADNSNGKPKRLVSEVCPSFFWDVKRSCVAGQIKQGDLISLAVAHALKLDYQDTGASVESIVAFKKIIEEE